MQAATRPSTVCRRRRASIVTRGSWNRLRTRTPRPSSPIHATWPISRGWMCGAASPVTPSTVPRSRVRWGSPFLRTSVSSAMPKSPRSDRPTGVSPPVPVRRQDATTTTTTGLSTRTFSCGTPAPMLRRSRDWRPRGKRGSPAIWVTAPLWAPRMPMTLEAPRPKLSPRGQDPRTRPPGSPAPTVTGPRERTGSMIPPATCALRAIRPSHKGSSRAGTACACPWLSTPCRPPWRANPCAPTRRPEALAAARATMFMMSMCGPPPSARACHATPTSTPRPIPVHHTREPGNRRSPAMRQREAESAARPATCRERACVWEETHAPWFSTIRTTTSGRGRR